MFVAYVVFCLSLVTGESYCDYTAVPAIAFNEDQCLTEAEATDLDDWGIPQGLRPLITSSRVLKAVCTKQSGA